MYVYVINKHGKPLMPCKPRKARVLLQNGKATVVKKIPFTIQLLYGSSGYRQPVSLGMDAGSKQIGIAVTTEKKVLYAEELQPRNDVVNLLSSRRQNRRTRRNRKTRYREARFDNRVHSRPEGWIAPSVHVKIQEHISAVLRIQKILPVSEIHVETAEFDTQRLKAMMDRGSEFVLADETETRGNGTIRTRMYYCDSMASWQKGSLENIHLQLRKICPKGADLYALGLTTQEKAFLICSHINSYVKKKLDDKTSFQLVEFYNHNMAEALYAAGMDQIPADQVTLKPYLLKEDR